MRRFALIATLLTLTLTAGCSLAPDYQRPRLELPETWKEAGAESLAFAWWTRFNDPVLTRLVEEALMHNRDIAAAAARVDYARAQVGLARAERFPLLAGQAQTTPTWIDHQKALTTPQYSAGFGASWELDLWGKFRSASDAAKAQLMASEASRRGVRLSVAAQTAVAYFTLRSLDLQLATTESTLKTREEALGIYTARFEQGVINELDLMQAKTVVETAKTALYRTRAALDAAEGALIAMVGRSPRDIMYGNAERGLALEAIPAPPVIPPGVPSDLLERRPDIMQAEQSLVAANANIGVARAAYFPTISLTGLFGIISPQLSELFNYPNRTWNYGATGSVPLLDFGRVSSNVDAAEAKQREALAQYEGTVQKAFKEIRDALAKQREATNIVESLERMVADLRVATDLARSRYDNGYSSYLEVLDAERSLFQSEMDLASARSDRLASVVNVCLSLGGGWE